MYNFTLIIPTHNRHSYLERSIAYFKNLKAEVIYCDSSSEAYEMSGIDNIRYLHLPGINFSAKLQIALQQVKSDFVVMCADDDFILIDSLYLSVEFLQKNTKFKTIVGKYLSFNENFDGRFFEKYQKLPTDIFYSTHKNATVFFSNYYQILWAMYQKNILIKSFEIVNKAAFRNENFIELTVGAIACYEGGIKFINEIWGVREISTQDHWGTKHPSIVNVETDEECRKDYLKFEKLLDEMTSDGYAEIVIKSYIPKQKGHRKTIFTFVKTSIPAGVLNFFRKIKIGRHLSQKEASFSAKEKQQLAAISNVIYRHV